jgi:hypothetical protein
MALRRHRQLQLAGWGEMLDKDIRLILEALQEIDFGSMKVTGCVIDGVPKDITLESKVVNQLWRSMIRVLLESGSDKETIRP